MQSMRAFNAGFIGFFGVLIALITLPVTLFVGLAAIGFVAKNFWIILLVIGLLSLVVILARHLETYSSRRIAQKYGASPEGARKTDARR